MKITENRLKALRAIGDCPGMYASGIADLFPRVAPSGTKYPWSRQGATRWGCGYAEPMVKAGLLVKDTRVEYGGARYRLTAYGEQVVRDATFVREHIADVERTIFGGRP